MAYPRFSWDFEVETGANDIYFLVDATPYTATIPVGTYRVIADGASGTDILNQVESQMNSEIGSSDITITLADSATSPGWVNIEYTGAGTELILNWSHVNCTFPAEHLGYDSTSTDSGDTEYNGVYPPEGTWFPHRHALNDFKVPHKITSYFEAIGAADGEVTTYATWETRLIEFQLVYPIRVLQDHIDDTNYSTLMGIETADPNIALENLWEAVIAGTGIYYHRTGSSASEGPYYLWGENADFSNWQLLDQAAGSFYSVTCWLKK